MRCKSAFCLWRRFVHFGFAFEVNDVLTLKQGRVEGARNVISPVVLSIYKMFNIYSWNLHHKVWSKGQPERNFWWRWRGKRERELLHTNFILCRDREMVGIFGTSGYPGRPSGFAPAYPDVVNFIRTILRFCLLKSVLISVYVFIYQENCLQV